MDEEDFINSLGWNEQCLESVDELVVSGANDVSGNEPEATASTSQDHNSPLNETSQGNAIDKSSESVKLQTKGRPPKSAYENLKPTRESQRIKRNRNLMNYQRVYTKRERNEWSQADLATFKEALEEFGPQRVTAIRTKLTHKTELEIRKQIELWKGFAHASLMSKMVPNPKKRSLSNSCAKLDDWIEHFQWLASTSSTKPFALTNVFALISEYGNIPPPEECNGINFRAMYRFLHCLLNGEPYSGMNRETAREINLNLAHMMSMIKDYNCVTNLQPHLYNLTYPSNARWRNYGRQPCRRKIADLKPELIMNLPHLNPLKIPPHMLVKPSTALYYSDVDSVSSPEPSKHELDAEDSND